MVENSPERRESPRLPVSTRVVYKEADREEVFITEDLSLGGLFIKTEKPPGMGTKFDLEISIPGYTPLVKAKGEVMWRHDGRGCGVRFVRLTAENKKILKIYLDGLK